ncbi:MAG: hypothetical protein Aurels2KO_25560 [Aureliella sp.]
MGVSNIKNHAKDVVADPSRFTVNNAELPVGTIIPYHPYTNIELPTGWVLCAGQIITDADSPFNGQKVPDLTDERFLMGTTETDSFAHYGGTNQIPVDGTHNHGGATGSGGNPKGADNDDDFDAAYARHSHPISPDGAHNHGGDNRPQFFGLVYLIKVKKSFI